MTKINARRAVLSAALLTVLPFSAHATNGMNMEGYGPIASAMGGASMGYDNGTAAMMNNVATLGLMEEGSRLDVFFGFLGPDVDASAGGQTANSGGTAYWMPAAGFVRKRDGMTLGVGLYGQGGMGTEYSGGSFLGNPGAPFGVTSNLENRTELSVGRVILPVAWEVSPRVNIGGSLDLVWAGLDLRMAMSGAQFTDLVSTQTIGQASGSLVSTFNGLVGGGAITRVNFAYFDFTNGSRFSGKARAYGYAGKLGATFRVNDRLTLGATYHSETRLGDMKTGNAKLRFGVQMMGSDVDIPVSGTVKVKDFQWPATWAVGGAFQATDRLLLVADVKRINWADTMQNFAMSFQTDSVQADPQAAGFAGLDMDMALYQRWENQTIYQLGGAYAWNRQLTLRAGINVADNPVPDQYLNALFPAIVEQHVTAGFGYAFNDLQSIDFSVQRGLKVSFTNPGNGSTIPAVTSTHAQWNFQFIYSHRF